MHEYTKEEDNAKGITLRWIGAVGAVSYTVKRSIKSGGLRVVVTKNVKGTTYTDTKVKPGAVCYYTVSATNAKGESGNAYEAGVANGLPPPWKQQSIGNTALKGATSFDGNVFTVEGVGTGVDSTADETQFTYRQLTGNGEITLRFVPQPSSQFSEMGLTFRDGTGNNSPQVSLVLYPGRTEQIEAPAWQVRLVTRSLPGESAEVNNTPAGLTEPAVTFGRLTGYCWLRLQRKGNKFFGYSSYDGKTWTEAGSVSVPIAAKALVGFSVASGMPNATTVFFDNVSVRKR